MSSEICNWHIHSALQNDTLKQMREMSNRLAGNMDVEADPVEEKKDGVV
jgi:hypothetical protein